MRVSQDASPEELPRIAQGRDDVGFIAATIDRLIANKIADPNRIYVTGISNGAFMTNRLSLSIPDKIAAVAPVAGTLPLSMLSQDNHPPALPIIYFHGTKDRLVGIDGSDFITSARMSFSAPEFMEWWAGRNGIADLPVEEKKLPDTDPSDNCRVTLITRESKEAPVYFYRINGGGHTWPGGSRQQPEKLLGEICFDINASELIWDFFQDHPKTN